MGITFLYPSFLWALTLISIPILIHLFNFRKFKSVYFSNVEILKTLEQRSKKTKSLRNWIILVLRIVAIAALVIAFAYPIETAEKKQGEKLVCLYIDNSFSMDADGLEGNKFDLAKSFADKIIQEFDDNTKFQILTNNFKGEHQFLYSKDKTADLISEITVSNASQEFQTILNRQLNFLKKQESKNSNIFWISDFQSLTDSSLFNPDSIDINFCMIASGENKNISLDSIWFESPVRSNRGLEEIWVKVNNHSQTDVNVLPVELNVGAKKNQQTIALKANESRTISFTYSQPTDSVVNGVISLEDGNLKFDNQLYFSYPIKKQASVYVISESEEFNKTIHQLFKNDSTVKYSITHPNQVNYTALSAQDLVILGEIKSPTASLFNTLQQLSKDGLSVAIFPSAHADIASYQNVANVIGTFAITKMDTNQLEIETIKQDHSFFKDVFQDQLISENTKTLLPVLKNHLQMYNKSGDVLIFKTDGSPFLLQSENIYFFSNGISTECSNLKSNALIVPLFYQLVYNSIKSSQIQYFTNNFIKIAVPASVVNQQLRITSENTIPYTSKSSAGNKHIILPSNFQQEGHFQITKDSTLIGAFAVNNNRTESKPINNQITNLKAMVKYHPNYNIYYANNGNSKSIFEDSLNTKTYWFYFLIIGLSALLAEMLIIRWLSK